GGMYSRSSWLCLLLRRQSNLRLRMSRDLKRTMYPVRLRLGLIEHRQGYCFSHELQLRHDLHKHYHLHRTKQECGDPTTIDARYTSLGCCSSRPCTCCCIAQVQI